MNVTRYSFPYTRKKIANGTTHFFYDNSTSHTKTNDTKTDLNFTQIYNLPGDQFPYLFTVNTEFATDELGSVNMTLPESNRTVTYTDEYEQVINFCPGEYEYHEGLGNFCWPYLPPGFTFRQKCPAYESIPDGPFVERSCYKNGTTSYWGDYDSDIYRCGQFYKEFLRNIYESFKFPFEKLSEFQSFVI